MKVHVSANLEEILKDPKATKELIQEMAKQRAPNSSNVFNVSSTAGVQYELATLTSADVIYTP